MSEPAMSGKGRTAAITAVLACALLAAGCGAAAPAPPTAPESAGPAAAPLDTATGTAAGTWATVVMGGPAGRHNNFWQMFFRPAAGPAWRLITPPGTADNGGLVLAAGAGQALVAAFRPSQYLTFTPLTETRDGGRAWSALPPLGAALAASPDALAAQPGSGRLLALTTGGTAELAAPGAGSWDILARRRALAATPAGRRCGLSSLTAAAFTPAGPPLLAGACGRAGTAGVFVARRGSWRSAGPPLPAALSRQRITVLRLTRAGSRLVALLRAGAGQGAILLAAWSADGSRWQVSAPLRLPGAAGPAASSFGPAGQAAILTRAGGGEVITGPGGSWHPLPRPPPAVAALAPAAAGRLDALAVNRSRLTIWRLAAGGARWRRAQVISVPIQYGSSG